MSPPDRTVAERAQAAGVSTEFVTSEGELRRASADAVEAVLGALGERQQQRVIVAWQGRSTIDLPPDQPGVLTIELEGGGEIRATPNGSGKLELPAMPHGIHQATIESSARPRSLRIISAPNQCYGDPRSERRWGTFAPLYAIGRRSGSGCGDFRDLRTLCEETAAEGGSFVGTLPLLAPLVGVSSEFGDILEASPYAPVSRLFWNPLYLDIEAAPEFGALDARVRERAIADLAALRDDGADNRSHVDHLALHRALWPTFEAMASISAVGESALPDADSVLDYAEFLSETTGGVASVHAYCQREVARQLDVLSRSAKALGVDLYLDLPVGSHALGYDTDRFASSFASGISCGAPPDLLFAGGQNWGFPPLHPHALTGGDFDLARRIIATHCRYAGMLRIDHVMWLHRKYWIPDGFPATEGVYVDYPAEILWALLCLESHRHETVIIGEDLGTVPDEVRSQMSLRGAFGMHLAQFHFGSDRHCAIGEPSVDVVASLGTHDTPTFAGFWRGADLDLATELGHIDNASAQSLRKEREDCNSAVAEALAERKLLDGRDSAAEVAQATLFALASSRARFLLVSIEDLWGEPHPQNVPGTTDEVKNWTRRSSVAIDELEATTAKAVFAEIDRRRKAAPEPMLDRKAESARSDVTALSSDDLYLFGEGSHLQAFDFLGAHVCEVDGSRGVRFGVWAPNANAVSVIGDWNEWSEGVHALSPRQVSGVWEGFIAGVQRGDRYKFAIETKDGATLHKADPVAFRAEVPPKTASVVATLEYDWTDNEWMQTRRAKSERDAPISIYELHLGSFARVPEEGNRSLTYRELAARIAGHVSDLGFTHVELLPIMEHPFYGSWGYQSTGYFAPTSRYGEPQDLMALIDALHNRGLAVILDWVPSHFPNDAHGLAEFDGTHLFEHADPREGFHPDWQSCIFNYGRSEVRSFLLSSALFWCHHYHIDGIRVDAVASMLYRDYSRKEGEWIPNRYGGRENLEAVGFLRQLNRAIYSRFPAVQTYAEESTAWPGVSRPTEGGGLGFGYKWDMGWMHDTLRYLERDPVHRKHHQGELSFRMMYAFSENYVLSLSHDEVVHGKGSLLDKMPGDDWQRRANLRLLYGNMFTNPGKKLLFMGEEFGGSGDWDHESSIPWHLADKPGHAGIVCWLRDLNALYKSEPALHELDCEEAGFQWIDYSDSDRSVFAFARFGRNAENAAPIVVVANYTPTPLANYRIGVPTAGPVELIANSDRGSYGGSDAPCTENAIADDTPWHGHPQSIAVDIPPLALIAYRLVPAITG